MSRASRSPFPGMDPFMERHWSDVVHRLIVDGRDTIQVQLPEDLYARIAITQTLEDIPDRRPAIDFDERSDRAVFDKPILLRRYSDPIRVRSIMIYDPDERIITAIEVLSPWNKKPGKALEAYMHKREKYIDSETNLVEIDLIRAGDWTDMIGAFSIPRHARTAYRVTITQPELTGPLLYPISIGGKLPTIKVPLRPQDQPAKLNLQELIEKAYAMGRYHNIDYTQPCSPPLVGPEKQWADEVLAAAAKG